MPRRCRACRKPTGGHWHQEHEIRVPFTSEPTFPSVSTSAYYAARYLRVVAGSPDSDRRLSLWHGRSFRDAALFHRGHHCGVEIQAEVLNGLLQGRSIVDLPGWLAALLATSLVACCWAFCWCAPLRPVDDLGRHGRGVAGLMGSIAPGPLVEPAACLIGLLLSYLIWNWRRLSVILAYFGWELARLDNEPKVLPERRRAPASKGDVLQGRIFALNKPSAVPAIRGALWRTAGACR